MEELNESLVTLSVMLFSIILLILLISLFVVLLASPFIAIGIGLSFITWATCLPLPFC